MFQIYIKLIVRKKIIKQVIVFVGVLLICSACVDKNAKKQEIVFFNKNIFTLNPDESVMKITPEIYERFKVLLQIDSNLQVPIYRYIKAADHAIYIGLPFNKKTIASFKRTDFLDLSNTEKLVTDSISYIFFSTFQSNDSLFVSKYVTDVQNNLFYLITETKNKDIHNTLFNLKAIQQRIVKKNVDEKK